MSHEITEHDSVLLHTKAAWHSLGTIIEDDLTAVEAAKRSKIDWTVDGWPLLARNPVTGETVEIDSHVANMRAIETPEGVVYNSLGVVGSSYQRCQNIELAEFTDALAQTGEVVIETCGTLKGGKHVWFLARGDSYSFGDDVSHSYLLVANSHDGSRAISCTPTDIRVVCANTLQAVTGSFDDPGSYRKAAISIRHSGNVSDKLNEARYAIRHFNESNRLARDTYAKLAETKIDEAKALEFFAGQYAANFAASGQNAKSKAIEEARYKRQAVAANHFLKRFREESEKFGGQTVWLALNAWTGVLQHDLRPAKTAEAREKADYSRLFGAKAGQCVAATADAVALSA